MNFTIPKTTPPGKYLVRVEQFNIISIYMQTQHYINCAQIEVVGPGGGTPGPFIKFPGKPIDIKCLLDFFAQIRNIYTLHYIL